MTYSSNDSSTWKPQNIHVWKIYSVHRAMFMAVKRRRTVSCDIKARNVTVVARPMHRRLIRVACVHVCPVWIDPRYWSCALWDWHQENSLRVTCFLLHVAIQLVFACGIHNNFTFRHVFLLITYASAKWLYPCFLHRSSLHIFWKCI